MRINVWISFKGLQKGQLNGVSFPYTALCPSNVKKAEFSSILDVYDEIERIADKISSKKGFELGNSLYGSLDYFVDKSLLLNSNIQNRIKEFQFCKAFSCSPYPTLMETPSEIVDDFFIIEEELASCMKSQQEEKKDA